jgi:uncharacterized OB-fold protein
VTEFQHGDPTMRPYWEAAQRHELVAQHCGDCDSWQFYGRPFCLECGSDNVVWSVVAGTGFVYSTTTVHMKVVPHLDPPYAVGIVVLDEGPRLLTNFVEGDCNIGARVAMRWREREEGLPPIPVFAQVAP